MLLCIFCNKECKNDNSLRNHQRLCYSNPERQTTCFQHPEQQKEICKKRKAIKNQWRNPNYSISDITRKKLSDAAKISNANMSFDNREKRKATIAEKVKNGTWHTSLAKKMHISYNGVDLHGSWELAYAKWLDSQSIKWERCKDRFQYIYKEKQSWYHPDFFLIDTQEYVEIKGYETDKDKAKWSQFPKDRKLIILKKDELIKMQIIGR